MPFIPLHSSSTNATDSSVQDVITPSGDAEAEACLDEPIAAPPANTVLSSSDSPETPFKQNGRGTKVSSKEIWSLTWPQALMMLFQFLVGMTDVVVAGQISSHVQAALGIINQCLFFLLVFGAALVNGGVSAMSQSLGAGKVLRAERYIGLLFKVVGGVCIVILLLAFFFKHVLLGALQVPQEILPLTMDLWVIALLILPGNYLSVLTMGIFRSRKNVWIPLVSSIVVCVVNLFGDLGLGLGFFGMPNLGAKGLLLASIVSVAAGGLFNLAVLIRWRIVSRASFSTWRWEQKALPYLLKVALPAGGTQILWQLGYMVLFLITNTLPSNKVEAMAGLTVGLRVEAVLFLPAWAFSMTGTILVGHCLGAGDRREARRVGLKVAGSGALCMSLVALLLLPWVATVTAWIAPDPGVQEIARSYVFFNIAATPFTVTSLIMSGIFTGAGATIFTLLVFSFSTWVVRLPLAWYMGHYVWKDASGIFLAMLISQIVQSSLALYIFLQRDWYRFALTARKFAKEGQ